MRVIQIAELDPNDEFVLRFRTYTLAQLVEAYNREVGCTACASARGRYLIALYRELKRRPVDISVIDSGDGMWLDYPVRLDPSGTRLVLEPRPVSPGRRVSGWIGAWIKRHLY